MKEQKIPTLELFFIMVERKKRGEKDGMQISTADMVEDARQRKRLERIQREQNLQETRLMKEADIQAEMGH